MLSLDRKTPALSPNTQPLLIILSATLDVIDDEDETGPEYLKRYGEQVIVFNKKEAAAYTDAGDNFAGRRGVVFARNAVFDIAEHLGYRYFIVLDDDYNNFRYRFNGDLESITNAPRILNINRVWEAMVDYLESVPRMVTVAMAQGGDFYGGNAFGFSRRKAMNSFICSTERRFKFFGRINEDVNAYVTEGSKGSLFLTIPTVDLYQLQTQSNDGGLTGIYLDLGTYLHQKLLYRHV